MSKYLQIQIPKTCSENWDNMSVAKQGKFCSACQKNVIDFTLMSDDDVAKFFKKNTENVCGRFAADQLNTNILIPSRKIPWLKYFFRISIPAFLFSLKSTAQTNQLKGKVVCVETPRRSTIGEINVITNKIINGKIVDENNNPVSYASVKIKGTNQGVAADSNGNFKIDLPVSNPVLQFSAVGYSFKELDCSVRSNADTIKVKMDMHELSGFVGGVVAVTRIRKKIKFSLYQDFQSQTQTPFQYFQILQQQILNLISNGKMQSVKIKQSIFLIRQETHCRMK